MLPDSADLLRCLLAGGKSKVAGRLAGALRDVGRATLADQVRDTMRTAGYTVAETDPFAAARAPGTRITTRPTATTATRSPRAATGRRSDA
jgi:hypothetical protein